MQAGRRQRRQMRRPGGTGPTWSSQAIRAADTWRGRPLERTISSPAPVRVCSSAHSQQVSVRRTCRQKRSAIGTRRRGPRAAHDALQVRRGRR